PLNRSPLMYIGGGPGQRPRGSWLVQGKALVIGGSMSGLLAGFALSRRGWGADVYERVGTGLAGRGARVVAPPPVGAVVRGVGIDPTLELGVPVEFRRSYEVDGRLMGEIPCPQTLTSWDRIYRLLREGFPSARYHRGKTLARVEPRPQSVVAHFADG